MSKNTGNFMSLTDAVQRYGADATRFALADGGDGLEDANFLYKTANDAIRKLYPDTELREKLVAEADAGMLRSGPFTWNDRVFLAEMTRIAETADKAYAAMLFRVALKCFLLRPAKRKGRVSKGDDSSERRRLANGATGSTKTSRSTTSSCKPFLCPRSPLTGASICG